MHALVLLGGQGTRLRPLTYDLPKPMLPVVDRPMVFQIVDWLARHGVTSVVFALGFKSDAFVEVFASGAYNGITIVCATEPSPRDTAGGIAFAADAAGVAGERLIVVNGDILTDLDLTELIDFHERHGGAATIALTPVEDPSAFGVVPTDGEGRVLAFIEKPLREEAPTNMINAGTYVLEPSVLARIARDVPVSIERQIFPELVESGDLYAMPSDCYWLDTGTPERFLQAQRDILEGRRPQVATPAGCINEAGNILATSATVSGHVAQASFVGEGAVIGDGARVDASVIGAGATVRAGARVSSSVVMAGATVESDASLERSIIGPAAHVGEGASLVDTIVGSATKVGAHTLHRDDRLPGGEPAR